jgi:hypothetical protein
MKRALICLTTLALAALTAAAQEVPELINYQGLLTDAGGVPLATDTYDLSFSLYADADGTIVVWGPEAHEGAQVIEGQFNVILGSTVPLGDAFKGAERYLGVAVSPEAEITPRQRILSTPYALNAQNGNPVGIVNMWWGDIADVPYGWQLCDGSPITVGPLSGMNTPDLRDRFVRGAPADRTTRDVLVPAGNDSVTLDAPNLSNHNHYVSDAFWFENDGTLDNWLTGGAPEWGGLGFTVEGRGVPSSPGRYGNSGADTNNNAFLCKETVTRGMLGSTGAPFLHIPSHMQMFFIIRVL